MNCFVGSVFVFLGNMLLCFVVLIFELSCFRKVYYNQTGNYVYA